jgi:benzoyl-CoA-dihydrodiol lyase
MHVEQDSSMQPAAETPTTDWVDFQTHPSQYRHWKLAVDGAVATLALDVDENAGLRPGYKLKLNSYDLGVDIELHDALNRIRFEHPSVSSVIVTSAKDRVFCSGANIFMLGVSSHAWKVNFCKFTNETRNGMEDSSEHEGIKFLAAVNGACAGGGYELALACDEIVLIDDRSSAVSLPEVPLLGVLPGTGGLTRLTDKRRVRHDLADVFCLSAEGVRGQRAQDWRLVDAIAKPAQFQAQVAERAAALAAGSPRTAALAARNRGTHQGVTLPALTPLRAADLWTYRTLSVQFERSKRQATITVQAPPDALCADDIESVGAQWFPLVLARELDDAVLNLRTNEPTIGTWLIKTQGSAANVLAMDAVLAVRHPLATATRGMLRRAFSRLDVSSRSLFALVEPGSCFAGSYLELALACDRIYQLQVDDNPPSITLGAANFGPYPMASGQTRLLRRFSGDAAAVGALESHIGTSLDAAAAAKLGLNTATPDDLDWADELRMALEERAAMSPDALTGLEANLRFNGPETMLTRIFGRLSAWQNWIFQRPNAVGEKGALKVYGKGDKAAFDFNRV